VARLVALDLVGVEVLEAGQAEVLELVPEREPAQVEELVPEPERGPVEARAPVLVLELAGVEAPALQRWARRTKSVSGAKKM
jgi:hypothetical protein